MPLPRKLSYGLLTAGLLGGAALGVGDPPADRNPFRGPPQPQPLQLASLIDLDIDLTPKTVPHPAAALEWAGPAKLRVGERGEYTLTVRNTSAQPLQKVVVQVRAPKDAVSGVTPPAAATDGVYRWEVGTLEPAAAARFQLGVVAKGRGDLGCQAWVTVTGTAGVTVAVRQPKLACKVIAPATVALGDKVPVTYVVTNTGDTKLENVVLRRGAIDDPVPPLAPGQEFRKVIEERTSAGGERAFPASVVGSDNTAAEATAKTRVLVPKLTATVGGPAERIVGRKAMYTVTVTNAGEVPLDGVTAVTEMPTGLRLVDADGVDTKQTAVRIGAAALAPGQTMTHRIEAVAATPGVNTVTTTATARRGTKASAECRTAVDGIPAIRMEVVDLADPVELNGATTYEVRILNTGTKAAAAVGLVCELPDELRYVSCDGPTAGKPKEQAEVGSIYLGVSKDVGVKAEVETRTHTTVTFDPITELAPKTEAVYRVKVKAVRLGDVRFRATLTSQSLSAPVAKEESTRVFGE